MEIKNETITISFDPGDWATMQKLCSEHEKYPCQLWGHTSNNEDCIIEICADHITTEVFQKNGWVRKNVFYPKENTVEEIYQEKWRERPTRCKKKTGMDR